MKKLNVKEGVTLIRLVVTLCACLGCATSIIILPVIWGIIVSGVSLIMLALTLIATEQYV